MSSAVVGSPVSDAAAGAAGAWGVVAPAGVRAVVVDRLVGDVLDVVDLPYVYVGIGARATNSEGAEWLSKHLGEEATVVPVRIENPDIFHLDTCMTLVGNGQGIICREVLADPLPHPLSGYDFIEVDAKALRFRFRYVFFEAPKGRAASVAIRFAIEVGRATFTVSAWRDLRDRRHT